MNKQKRIILACVALLVVVCAIVLVPKLGQDKGDKEVTIILKDNDKVLYEESVDTDAGLLSELLKELEEEEEIQFAYEDSAYGMFITGMGVDKLIENDASANTYWTYSSENNKQCVEAGGFCDAAESLKISDGDVFVFTYAKMTY